MPLRGYEKFLKNIRRFYPEEVVRETLETYSQDMVNAVKLQLARGLDGNGAPVYLIRYGRRFKGYAPATIVRKHKMGGGLSSVTDHVTNYMSGRFYASLFVEIQKYGYFEIKSSSPLIDLIKYRSGQDIIKLSPESEMFIFQMGLGAEIQAEINALFYE